CASGARTGGAQDTQYFG
nr:T-cell receptor V region beta-chain, TCR V beta {colony 4-2} [mice, NOD, intrathyroidal T cells, Peptide Partial, 17 aa] [Mus sp.]